MGRGWRAILAPAAKAIAYIEDESRPLHHYVLTFLAAVTLRWFLEIFAAGYVLSEYTPLWLAFLHVYVFFVYAALFFAIIFYFLTRERVERVVRTVMTAFMVIVLPPLIDIPLSLLIGYEVKYAYMMPGEAEHLLRKYLFFFGDHSGASLGIRIEIAVAMAMAALYVSVKTSSLFRALLGGLLLYTFIFWGLDAIPFAIKGVDDLAGLLYDTSPTVMIETFLFLSLPLLFLLAYFGNTAYTKAILKDIRLTRVLHYELMVVLGLALGFPEDGGRFVFLPDVLEFYFIILAVVFACIFSAITNNLADLEIDRISNPGRPSVTGVIPEGAYKRIALLSLIAALALSFVAGTLAVFLIACFIGNYFLYSMPPFRLKRIPFFSKVIIALNCLIAMFIGYSFAGQEISAFPTGLVIFVLAFFTACINFIDIKDYEGDRAEGIRTLPVMLGLRWSKALIGLFFVVSYALFPYFLGHPQLLPISALFGVAIFFAVNRKRYNEKPVFILYLSSMVLLLVYLYSGT